MKDVLVGHTPHVRVSARAVVAGALVGTALFGVFAELIGAFGFVPASGVFDLRAAETLVRGAALWSVAWIGTMLVTGFVASTVANARSARDGVLNGVVAWAATCFTVGTLFWAGYLAAVRLGLATPDVMQAFTAREVFLGGFVYDVAAIVASALGGVLGAREGVRVERTERKARARYLNRPATPHTP